jgi:membrane protease YdiL (CAAX protease family)
MARTLCCALVNARTTTAPVLPQRLAAWCVLVTGLIAAAYYSNYGVHTKTNTRGFVYSFHDFAYGLVQYAFWLGIVLLIAVNRHDLLALRRPVSWRRVIGPMAIAAAVIVAADVVTSLLPLPEAPGKEQGLTPTHWESAHAAAFAANLVLFAVVAPFVEELTFRGVGQSLLRFLGRVPSILIVGTTFGLAHGLLEAELVLIPFGLALAWLRDRVDTVVPGMILHGLFNGTTLVLSVTLLS